MTVKYVFAGGMQRSGSTLQYNIAAELVERLGIGRRTTWDDDHESFFHRRSDETPCVVFKSHILSAPIAELLSGGHAVAVTSYRDIRDVAASFQAKTGHRRKLKEVVRQTGNVIDQFSCWESLPPERVLVSRYETMVNAIPDEVARIAAIIGLTIRSEDVDAVSRAVDSQQLKQRIRNLSPADVERYGPFVYDRKTLLHVDHLNGGEIGRYRSELTRPVIRKLTAVHRDWLESHGYSTLPSGGRVVPMSLWK